MDSDRKQKEEIDEKKTHTTTWLSGSMYNEKRSVEYVRKRRKTSDKRKV